MEEAKRKALEAKGWRSMTVDEFLGGVTVSDAAYEQIQDLIENPPEPTEYLKETAALYNKTVTVGSDNVFADLGLPDADKLLKASEQGDAEFRAYLAEHP